MTLHYCSHVIATLPQSLPLCNLFSMEELECSHENVNHNISQLRTLQWHPLSLRVKAKDLEWLKMFYVAPLTILSLWSLPFKYACLKDCSLAEILPGKFFPQKSTWLTPSSPLSLCWNMPSWWRLPWKHSSKSNCTPLAFLIPFPCFSFLHRTYQLLSYFMLALFVYVNLSAPTRV